MKIFNKKSMVGGVVVLALGGAGLWYYLGGKNQALYQTATIDKGTVRASISATGSCNAVVTVQVGSQVSGNIKALYADFNTKVKKGQLVAEIDPQVFQARVDQTKASLDSANASVVSARAQEAKAEADISSARAAAANQNAAISKAKAAAQDASRKLAARKSLFQQGIISKEDMDTAQSTYDQAVAEQQAAAAQLDAANHQIQAAQATSDVAKTQLSSAQSQVKQAQASLEQAQLDLDHTRIIAPVDGTVIARHMDVGQTVAASFQAPTIFEVAQDLTKMQVDTNVDEADVGQVKLNQPVKFTVDAYPGTTFPGSVTQIRQAPINVQNVITYDIVVAVSNPDLKLFPGMTANVKILTNQVDDVIKIPNAALRFKPADVKPETTVRAAGRRQDAGASVWILGTDGKPQQVKVKLGITDGFFTAVESGDLKQGEQVITGSLVKNASTPAPRGPQGPRF
ncbi:MAG TPA: efflux RND transporter periplasmic adaptor subunit [Bryobacteraceae bacterium]|nr:efflux RND transporter periplasmic adaptor subunit [Bryobacteraceae bacterium]